MNVTLNKVIFVGYQPLTEKVKQDFYFSSIENEGFFIEYWDLSLLFFEKNLEDRLFDPFIKKITTFQQLNNTLALCDKEKSFFILNITYEYRVLKLYYLLTKHKCTISFFARGSLPVSHRKSSLKEKIIKGLSPLLVAGFLKNWFAKFVKGAGIVKAYDIVFTAGKCGYLTIGVGADYEMRNSTIVEINSHDFDAFLKEKSQNEQYPKFCVFLDEYLPYHPDFKLLGIKTVDVDKYYDSLNSFFDFVEEKFMLKVVIAAHPKAENYHVLNPFKGRDLVFNNTSQLTKDCEFVLAHISTSQSFAVLNNKQIITLTCSTIIDDMTYYNSFIESFSQSLGTCLINTDEYLESDVILMDINSDAYNLYKYNYLTTEASEKHHSKDILLSFLSRY